MRREVLVFISAIGTLRQLTRKETLCESGSEERRDDGLEGTEEEKRGQTWCEGDGV